MTVAYFVVAGLLAALYLFSGGIKVVRSRDRLRPMMQWVDTMPLAAVRAIGLLEVAGAVGLILPPVTGVLPPLAFAAAVGLVLVQIGAIALHLRRGEIRVTGFNAVLLVLAVVAAWLATIWL